MSKIFVSSTFLDLHEFRKKVENVIRRARHLDIAMEYYVAEDERPVDRCLKDVEGCDVYIGIFAWRRGWIPADDNPDELSITEMEYRRALATGKRCLIFLLDGKVPWPPEFVDDDKKRMAEFRASLTERHGGDRFTSIDDLAYRVVEAIHRWEMESGLKPPHDFSVRSGSQYLEAPANGPGFDLTAVETFRMLLRPECRHEFPLGVEAASFLKRVGVLFNQTLTKSGVLLFWDEPTVELVTAYIQCVKFERSDKSSRSALEDIHGNAYAQIVGAVEFVRRHTLHVEYFAEGVAGTVRVNQYPMKCLREMLANAVCHRDYRDAERCIQVCIFSDRVEILSPGEWMGGKQLSLPVDLGEMRSESIARNPVLARLLAWVKAVERQGSGINRAVRNCIAEQAPTPKVEQRDGYVAVTVFPSDKFRRINEGEAAEDVVTPSKEALRAALEREQFALVKTSNSASEKLNALRRLGRTDPRSACWLLRNLPEIEPEATLEFLNEQPGWDGEDLVSYVSNWLYAGSSEDACLGLLLHYARRKKDHKELAYVYYALSMNRIAITSNQFFAACWHPAPASLRLVAVRIPSVGRSLTFTMGCEDEQALLPEHPAHNVELSSYSIGVTPVTREEYSVFAGKPHSGNVPIASVSWWESWIFCKWAGGDLPTEAQWECACRAGTTTRWWFGDDVRNVSRFAWTDEAEDADPHPVGQRPSNPWGLHDVHGNVSEWCLDRYGPYVAGSNVDPKGPESGFTRVLRGGNAAVPPEMTRSSSRDHSPPGSTSLVTGFRVAFNE
jgi:hypothetical protein